MATAIFDITHRCLDYFDRIAAKRDDSLLSRPFVLGDTATDNSKNRRHPSRNFLGLRNSFLLWIDYTGALSLMDSSLDTRLQGFPDLSSMVIELLAMILRNLPRLISAIISKWEDVLRAIDTALDRLHFIAVAIRKASAKKVEYNAAIFLTDDRDAIFSRDVASLVRCRFPAARQSVCHQIGNSIAARRRMLLQKHSHAKKLAVRRVMDSGPPTTQPYTLDIESKPRENSPPNDRIEQISTSAVTRASRLDSQASVLKQLHLPKRPTLKTEISTISITQQDLFEYPPLPRLKRGEIRVQCPYCLMPLDFKELEDKGAQYWKRHVDEDIKPYACIFPRCAEALVFFSRRHEWKSHMDNVHSKDWPRKVHTIIWYCDIDHVPPERFETELQWRMHMSNVDNHPKRQITKPTKAQLDALSPRKRQAALRERFVCPLCEQIPENIRLMVEKEIDDPATRDELLIDHIANHIKSLSLLSIPCLDNADVPLTTSENSSAIRDSFKRVINEGSVPQPPSGGEYLDRDPLPSDSWSHPDSERPALYSPDPVWDKEFPDYTNPEIPPDLSDEDAQAWEAWITEKCVSIWQSAKSDQVITYFKNVKLLMAIHTGDEDLARSLLGNSANIEAAYHGVLTPLCIAAEIGHIPMVQLLLDMGANIEATSRYGQTPLSEAARNGHMAVVQHLLDKGAKVEAPTSEAPLVEAASNGHIAIMKLLLDRGANIDATSSGSNTTPLIEAAVNGHITTVQYLLDNGAKIEAADKIHGHTPLTWAAERERDTVVQLLLDRGANIEAVDETFGQTPLLWATRNGHDTIVQLLLDRGANIEAADTILGRTSLSLAAQYGHDIIVQLLLDRGANIETTSISLGQTPLLFAAQYGHGTVVQLLLDRGANIETVDEANRSPLYLAAKSGHEAIVRLFLDRGLNIETTDKLWGRTPLLAAVEGSHSTDTVQLLLDRGANINAVANNGDTPLRCARDERQWDIERLLRLRGAR